MKRKIIKFNNKDKIFIVLVLGLITLFFAYGIYHFCLRKKCPTVDFHRVCFKEKIPHPQIAESANKQAQIDELKIQIYELQVEVSKMKKNQTP